MSIITQGYIIHTNPVVRSIKEYLWDELLVGLNDKTKHLFSHILKGHELNLKDSDGWTPIASKLIEKKLKGADWKMLDEIDLIEVSSYSKQQGLSREFRVRPDLFFKIQRMRPWTTTDILAAEYYNLCNGKSLNRKKPTQTKYYDANRNPIFVGYQKNAVKLIKPCKVNRKEVDQLLYKRKLEVDSGLCSDKEELRYLHDLRCWEGIVRRMIGQEGDFIVYQSAWDSQDSCRITELDGGLQNASRELKDAMIKDTGYINLDLKGSQVYGAKTELERFGIDTSWFDRYQVAGKQKLADDIGIKVDNWKGLLCSILMGGFPGINKKGELMAKNMDDLIKYKCVRKYVCPEVGIDVEWDAENNRYNYLVPHHDHPFMDVSRVFEIVGNVIKECRPLIDGINQWHVKLFDAYVANTGNNKARFIATNKADGRLNVSQYVKKGKHKFYLTAEGKRKLAAHILQGKEAAFIHYITAFSGEDFTVVSNQHDGLIIEGTIPMELIHNARSFSGLPYADLEEKSIH